MYVHHITHYFQRFTHSFTLPIIFAQVVANIFYKIQVGVPLKLEIVESLQSHYCIHTQFHWSSGPPICFPSWGTWVQSPRGVLKWNRDSPVSIVSLHSWPCCNWSLWPRLRQASSRTVTRPSSQQCDNPTWSHTALLSWFHALCRSSFWLHNQHSQLLGRSPVESLKSHCIHTQFHWSTPLLPIMRNLGSIPRGVLMWNMILLLALSRYKIMSNMPQHWSISNWLMPLLSHLAFAGQCL